MRNQSSAGWVTMLLAVAWMSVACRADDAAAAFRIGFSSSMFSDVNENDGRAAVKAWGQAIAKERSIPTDPDPRILRDIGSLREAVRGRQVDAVGITMVEYASLHPEVRFDPIFITYNGGKATEQYVLLAHRESRIADLKELQGRTLRVHLNPRLCLALPWLDVVLVQHGQKPAVETLGRIVSDTKLAKVVLPVFFRQADACLVTRSGFETITELNPQVGEQLTVLASSAELVPAVFALRADYSPSFKEKLVRGIRDLHASPTGQQVLTIFHSERIEDRPASCLESAMELIASRQRLLGPTSGGPTSSLPRTVRPQEATLSLAVPSPMTPKTERGNP